MSDGFNKGDRLLKIYTTSKCSACKSLKERLYRKNIPFKEVDVTKIPPDKQFKILKGRTSVPIIMKGKSIIEERELWKL